MEIIKLEQPDVSALENLKAKAWSVADKEHYGEILPNFFKEEFTLLAKEGEEVIGYITIICDSGVAQIEPLMVDPDRKGQGIGSLLLQEAEIDYIRGVNSNFILRNLLMRGLVERIEHETDKRSLKYRPTFELLSFLGIGSVEELPEYETTRAEIEARKEASKKEDLRETGQSTTEA
jgi:GNAT superfamily N-acetyltransferase